MRTILQSALALLALATIGPGAIAQPPQHIATWGSTGSAPGQFTAVRSLAVDPVGGYIYAVDSGNDRIQKFNPDSSFVTMWGSPGTGDTQFDEAEGIAVDPTGSFVYVTDRSLTTREPRVRKFDPQGNLLAIWGEWGALDGQFNFCTGIAVDANGDVYVADTGNNRIQKFAPDSTHLQTWTSAGSEGPFNQPYGVAAGGAGNVYVADSFNHRIIKFDTDGNVQGSPWGSVGSGNGQFLIAIRVAVDPAGNVYVCDRNNHRIQRFDSSGTFLAAWGAQGVNDGQFQEPHGAGGDAGGNVYVADTGNNRIQKFGYLPVALEAMTWTAVKARYR